MPFGCGIVEFRSRGTLSPARSRPCIRMLGESLQNSRASSLANIESVLFLSGARILLDLDLENTC